MSNKILIVDDEARMRKLVSDFLKKEGYETLQAKNGRECLDIFNDSNEVSLIILDVMMPKMDGIEVLKNIRQFDSKIPVIMLTAKDEEEDELKGFKNGADEYISKPFSPKILVARVNAILKRTKTKSTPEDVIVKGDIELDITSHSAKVCGKEIILSYKEFELLEYFMKNEDIALSREKILNYVWDYEYFGDARTIDTHVKKLRKKLGKCSDYITTIWGMGYKFKVI